MRWFAPLAALALVVAAAPAGAQTPPPDATISGFATGSTAHLHVLQVGGDESATRLVNADVAFSGAAVDAGGLSEAQSNEMGLQVHGAMGDKTGYGRGSGLELGLAGDIPEGVNDVILAGQAEASAPPATDLVTSEVGPANLDPLAWASLLRGQAEASFTNEACVLGRDLSSGLGYVADAQVLNLGDGGDGPALPGLEGLPGLPGGDAPDGETPEVPGGEAPQLPGGETPELPEGEAPEVPAGTEAAQQEPDNGFDSALLATDAPDPQRAVSQSTSRTFLTAQTNAAGERVGNAAAVASEVRQTIAPVTLFKGTENEVTIEVLGEWVLRAVATGVPGSSFVHYGPEDASPETPVVRIIQGGEVSNILTLQQLLGEGGLEIPIDPVLNISLGEAPRAIGGDFGSAPAIADDGTSVAAAVDVVRIEILDVEGTGELAEARVGHMETAAQAPAGGVLCEIPIDKRASASSVTAGQQFTYTITVTNPYECPLNDVRVVDTITATSGVAWDVVSTSPEADQVSPGQVVWEGRGPIPPGGSQTFEIVVRVSPTSAAGTFTDVASATGLCGSAPVTGEVDVRVPVTGEGRFDGPRVGELPDLPRTGAGGAALLGLAAMAVAGVLRRKLS